MHTPGDSRCLRGPRHQRGSRFGGGVRDLRHDAEVDVAGDLGGGVPELLGDHLDVDAGGQSQDRAAPGRRSSHGAGRASGSAGSCAVRQAVEPLRDAAWGQGFPVFAGEGEPRLGHPAPHCERSSWAFRCVRKTATVTGSRATVRSFFSLVGRLSPPENRRVRSPGHEAETATRRRRWRLACPTWRSGTCSGGCPMPRSQQVFDDRYTGGRTALPGRKVRRSTCLRN